MKKILALMLALTMIFATLALTACSPNIANVEAKLKEAKYIVVANDEKDETEGERVVLTATKIELLPPSFEMLVIIEFDDMAAANEYAKEVKESGSSDYLTDAKGDAVVKSMGKTIIVGTKQALEDAGL